MFFLGHCVQKAFVSYVVLALWTVTPIKNESLTVLISQALVFGWTFLYLTAAQCVRACLCSPPSHVALCLPAQVRASRRLQAWLPDSFLAKFQRNQFFFSQLIAFNEVEWGKALDNLNLHNCFWCSGTCSPKDPCLTMRSYFCAFVEKGEGGDFLLSLTHTSHVLYGSAGPVWESRKNSAVPS